VRALASTARSDLLESVENLLRRERDRFAALVDASAPSPDAALSLRAALEDFEQARRATRGSIRPGGRSLDVGAAR
jgi:hypothetical protein